MNLRPRCPSVMSVPGRRDAHLLVALDPLGEARALLGGALPGAERVGVVGQAGAEVEVLELAQAHLGVGGVGVGREERVDPAVDRPRRSAASTTLHQLAVSPPGASPAAPGSTPDSSRVLRVGADRDPAVGLLGRPLGERRDPLELGVGRVLEEGRGLALEGEREDRDARRPRGPPRRPRRSGARPPWGPRSRRCRPPSPRSSSEPGSGPGCSTRGSLTAVLALPCSLAARRRAAVAIAISRACTRESSVSSGWKAQSSTSPWRTATGCPSTSARTSTAGPCSSIHGARMKTARIGSGPRPSIVELGLEARDLAAEGVAPRDRVDQAEVLAIADDHSGAGAEDRAAALGVRDGSRRPARRARSPW